MNDEEARMVADIKARCGKVTSLVGSYSSVSRLQLMPFETRGRFYFLRPDKCRSESVRSNGEIITVRNGSRVERRLPARREIWKYDLKDLPQTLPINYGIADFADPFFLVEEEGLIYEGEGELENVHTLKFSSELRNGTKQGVLDTRKGFSIRFQPMNLQVRVQLHIQSETGLLRRMTGTDREGKALLEANYFIEGINGDLEESLFSLEKSSAAYTTMDITDLMLSAMNPGAADDPPSVN